MADYAIQAGMLSKEIYIGKINKAHTEFTDKEAQTGAVLEAVAEWVEKNHDSDCWVTVGPYRMDIKVTRTDQDETKDSTS